MKSNSLYEQRTLVGKTRFPLCLVVCAQFIAQFGLALVQFVFAVLVLDNYMSDLAVPAAVAEL